MLKVFNINNKKYWKIRNKLKKSYYVFLNFFYRRRNYLISKKKSWKITNELNKLTFKNSLVTIITISIVFLIDYLFYKFFINDNSLLHLTIFDNFIINDILFISLQVALLGVSGIFLGLYYSNMSSVFASRYAELPSSVSKLFENEIVGNKYVELLTNYIIIILLFLAINLVGIETYIIVFLYILSLTIRIVIAFSVLGKRVFRFSDFFTICNDIYVNIDQDIRNATINGFKYNDNGFQKRYGDLCEDKISKIKEIAVIGLNEKNVKVDSIFSFLINNLSVLYKYSNQKELIPHNSYWFKSINIYEPLHRQDHTNIQLYLSTGVPRTTKSKVERDWIETQILDINDIVINKFLKEKDFDIILKYYEHFSEIFEFVLDYNNTAFWINYVENIYKKMIIFLFEETKNDVSLELADLYCGMLKSMILSLREKILNIDLNSYKTFIDGKKFNSLSVIRSQLPLATNIDLIDFFEKVEFEINVEGRRITPDWLIIQRISTIYNNYIDESINALIELYKNTVYEIIKELMAKGKYENASIFLANGNDIYNKLLNLIHVSHSKSSELKKNYKDSYYIWKETDYDSILKELEKDRKDKAIQACNCAYSLFATQHKFKNNVPDFYGMAFYNICEICFSTIVENDLDNFRQTYPIALQNMIVQIWNIVSDIKGITSPFAFNAMSSSNVFLMEISGAAMLLSELTGEAAWTECVISSFDYLNKTYSSIDIAKDMINSAKVKKGLPRGLYNTDLILTNWRLRFRGMVNDKKLINFKESTPFYRQEIDSNNKVIKSYFSAHGSDFIDMFGDFRELFLLKVLNEYVDQEEKYKGRHNFE